MSAGIARGHRNCPAASIRVQQQYCTSVLFSGLASLVLSKAEVDIIDRHFQTTLQNLQKLHSRTPRSIVYLLAGSLPGEAFLHLGQLSLFSMICHLPEDPLHYHARYSLTALAPSARSWFNQIKELCLKYLLPHPLVLLEKPQPKASFKKQVKLRVTEYWQKLLAAECVSLDSLRYFDPHKSSLLSPHPMWTTTAGNSYESSKSIILARMTSGRYRTEMMCRFWSSNKNGYCLADTCNQAVGDLEHLLISCPALEPVRDKLRRLWSLKTTNFTPLHTLLLKMLASTATEQVKFILDSTACPEVITLVQMYGQPILNMVLYLTRIWAYSIHRQKMILLGRWPIKLSYQTNQDRSSLCLSSVHHTITEQTPPTDHHPGPYLVTGHYPDNLPRYDNNLTTTYTDLTYNKHTNYFCIPGDVPIQCPEVVTATEYEVPIDSLPDTVQDLSSLMLPGPVHPAANLQEVVKSAALVDRIGPGNCGGGGWCSY